MIKNERDIFKIIKNSKLFLVHIININNHSIT